MQIYYAHNMVVPHHRLQLEAASKMACHLFIAVDDAEVVGFAYSDGNYTVDFIGTRKDRRGQGVMTGIRNAAVALIGTDVKLTHTGHTSKDGADAAGRWDVEMREGESPEDEWAAESADTRVVQYLPVFQELWKTRRDDFELLTE